MKVEYINPFIEASYSVINALCGIKPTIGKIYIKSTRFSLNQIVIIIGIVGEIKGQVYFELHSDTAKKIASAMMGGMPVSELNEISLSAISEMGNMIMGNTSTLFSNKSIGIDITPPTVLSGDKIDVSNKTPTIVIPLHLEGYGDINININTGE